MANTGIQQSGTPSNAILTRYEKKYREGANFVRTYDQFAGQVEETFEPKGTTVQVFMKTDLQPRPTAAVGSQTADFTPQQWVDVKNTVSADYYADGVKVHEKAQLTNFSNVYAETEQLVGANMMQTVDALARRVATEGDLVLYGGARTSRSTLAGSNLASSQQTNDNLRDVDFNRVKSLTAFWRTNRFADGTIFCVIDDFQYADLIKQAGSQILNAGAYTEKGLMDFVLNWELGMLASIRIVVSPFAKYFYGAAAAAATAISGVTLGAAAQAGDRTVNLSGTITNLAVGDWLIIDTVQTSTESDATVLTEPFYITDKSVATAVKGIGMGPLGGLRYPHANAAVCADSTTAHCAVFGGPKSMVKVIGKELGEYGEMVPPFETGNAKQWTNFSWKWFGGYGIIDQSRFIRVETSALYM